MSIREFVDRHYLHFNAATVKDAAKQYISHIENGNKMFLAMAGAMSTAEIGKILAEMIEKDYVHAISCSANNLEEDIFNLVAHDHYRRIPNWRDLTPQDEEFLVKQHLNRVTDTCIPEDEAIRKIEHHIFSLWNEAEKKQESYFPYEYFYKLIRDKTLEKEYQIDPKDSWVVAAANKNIPIYTPGWEDSTLGNIFASYCYSFTLSSKIVKNGIDQMVDLINWYKNNQSPGFFQIGGGIAGDFPICVVPLLRQDLREEVPHWSYFCQISDSTTSYGSYSGAIPNEKITWDKLSVNTPKFMIESDATIVFPLICGYVLNK
jgi:deoxyhypusine synthase